MSLQHGKSKRRILPRWRDSKKASHSTDFAATRAIPKQPEFAVNPLPENAHDFSASRSIGTAAELLSNALLVGDAEAAREAIEFIRQNEQQAPQSLVLLAQSFSDSGILKAGEILLTENDQIRQTRRLLNLNPANPMLWSDLARHFASNGSPKRAKRAMMVALQLAPNHRWMLRTASRFLAHQNDAVAAHKLLANHPRTQHDPWLIAAELACAQVAGRSPKFWRQANDIVRFNNFAPQHTSELATAIAMMELEAGAKKKARKYVEKGLLAPTENTLAQVLWAKENQHLPNGLELHQLVHGASDAYEADYHVNVAKGDLLAAMQAAYTWGQDEPFAARPRIEVAYIASILDDHERTIEMARVVYRLDRQQNPTLEMNRIFATLSSGKLSIEDDFRTLDNIHQQLYRSIDERKDDAYHAMANLGLWYYRYGDKTFGHALYQKAIQIAEKHHLLDCAAMAATFAAREAILARDANSLAALEQAHHLARRSKNKANEFYLRKLDALRLSPNEVATILSPGSARRFLTIDKPPAYRLEKNSKGLVLVIPKKPK